MPRDFFKRHIPSRESLTNNRFLRPFAALFSDPGVWALSRRNTAKAFAVGIFAAWLPIPLQTVVVVLLVAWLRINLPVAILASFVSNPVTMGPMMVLAYKLGSFLLQRPPRAEGADFGLMLIWEEMGRIGLPLLTGSLVLGLVTGVIAGIAINIAWRYSLVQRYRRRRARRRLMGIRFRRPRKKPRPTDQDA